MLHDLLYDVCLHTDQILINKIDQQICFSLEV